MASVDRILSPPAQTRSETSRVSYALDVFFRSYAQILLSHSRSVGVILFAGTLANPRVALAGAVAVVLASALALALRFDRDLVRSGLYGYGPLLVGLGGATSIDWHTGSTPFIVVTLVIAVLATVLLTAALHSFLWGTMNLPVLTLPFLFAFHLLFSSLPILGLVPAPFDADPWVSRLDVTGPLMDALHSLGALFFLPRVDTGAVVLVALLVSSRIGTVLAALGFLFSMLVAPALAPTADTHLPLIVGYNFMLVGVALGGVWFVPSPASFVLAVAGVFAGALTTLGLLPLLSRSGLPLLVLPFNLVVLVTLAAMRQRTEDRSPKSVDFLLGSPEENLHYFRTRLARFGAHYWVRFRAPFLGRWVVTQGVNGELSHQGPWMHALDFEVVDHDKKRFRGAGARVTDFLCYHLPVLAVADGRVVKVVDGVRDNDVGELNLEQNWGNVVVIEHGARLYSMVAHLSPGSLKVREGQFVTQGEVLGLCGASGRADVPHLHFQLQASPRVGAPTIPMELHDLVTVIPGREELIGTVVLEEGAVARNLAPDDHAERDLGVRFASPMVFRLDGGREETITPDLDTWGNLLIRSKERGAVLYYTKSPGLFTVLDVVGGDRSVLHLVEAALGRFPFEAAETGLEWSDYLPRRLTSSFWGALAYDFISPFTPSDGIALRYRAQRDGPLIVVEGTSEVRDTNGDPLFATRAVLEAHRGIISLELTIRGRRRSAVRVESPTLSSARSASVGDATRDAVRTSSPARAVHA